MKQARVHADVVATLTRLQDKHSELKEELSKSWGFAVFPSVGRAAAVLGGAYGHGEVFEQGKSIGFATLSQISVGVQLGGQTFSQVILFPNKEALDEFRTGKVAFTANASGVIVKAAASGTTNFDGITSHAYSRGGMLLEASLGGQKFMFIPPEKPVNGFEPQKGHGAGSKEKPAHQSVGAAARAQEGDGPGQHASGSEERKHASSGSEGHGSNGEDKGSKHAGQSERRASAGNGASGKEAKEKEAKSKEAKGKEAKGESKNGHDGKMSLRKLGTKVVDKMRQVGGQLPVLKKEAEANRQLHAESVAALERMKERDESLAQQLEDAYAYAVFPAVGKASLVLGGSYGKGEVFREGKIEGYAGLVQLTLGLQVGGQTYSELVLFQDEEAFKRFKAGKIGFAGNLSAVIVKAGAAATNNYKQGMQIYVHSEGGLAAEAAIGGQKLFYVPARLMKKKSADIDGILELGRSRPAVSSPRAVLGSSK